MSARSRPRVLLAEDHPLVADALTRLVTTEFELVGVVQDGRGLLEAAGPLQPDVIVADVNMPHVNGIEALLQLRRAGALVPVVFLTMDRDVSVAHRALEAGASGYVLKHSAPVELMPALRAALEGRINVTPLLVEEMADFTDECPQKTCDPTASLATRQCEILQLLTEGRSGEEIASRLSISVRTVDFHTHQVMEKLGLHTKAELIQYAIDHRLG